MSVGSGSQSVSAWVCTSCPSFRSGSRGSDPEMATPAGIIFAAGGITMLNEALSVPANGTTADILKALNWKVIPATAIAAGLFTGLSELSQPVATRLAWLVFVTTLFAGFGTAPSVIQRLNDLMGFDSPPSNPVPKTGLPIQ